MRYAEVYTMKTESGAYLRRLKEMNSDQRFKIAVDLSSAVRHIAKSAIENEHPDWSPFQVQKELLRRFYGPNISAQVSRARVR